MRKNQSLFLSFFATVTLIFCAFKITEFNINVAVVQDGKEVEIGEESTVKLKKDKFSVRFNNFKYNSANKEYHAAHLIAFTDKADMEKLKTGMKTENIPCLEPGTGMAASKNGYEDLIFESEANHYLYYEDETDKRLNLIAEENGLLRLEFPVEKFYINEKQVEIKDARIDKFYMAIFIDKNQDDIIDKGELSKITIQFE